MNGSTEDGHPTVGILKIDGTKLCTATLIGTKTVLTAAHCIQSSHTFTLGGATYQATSAVKHPHWNSTTLANDIALVFLSEAPTIAPTPISTRAPTVGLTITLVGFGVTGEGQTNAGVKRVAKNTVNGVTTTRFSFAGSTGSLGNTCYGDSGGPAFATIGGVEVQIGVTSAGQKPCGTVGYDTRVDAYTSWIRETSGGDVNDGSTTPTPGPTPSKDTTPPAVSITSPAAGAKVPLKVSVSATVSDDTSVQKAEIRVDGALINTLTTPPFVFPVALTAGGHGLEVTAYDPAGNKGSAMVAVVAETAAPSPTPAEPGGTAEPGKGAFGAGCQSGADCSSGLCAEDAAAGKYCTEKCDPNLSPCPSAAGCMPIANSAAFACGPPLQSLPATPGTDDAETLALQGGCSVGARGASLDGATLALFALLAVFGLRRRS